MITLILYYIIDIHYRFLTRRSRQPEWFLFGTVGPGGRKDVVREILVDGFLSFRLRTNVIAGNTKRTFILSKNTVISCP